MISIIKRVRIRQIQHCSRLLRGICAVPMGLAIVKVARTLPLVRGILVALAGYNRPFPALKDAAAAIVGFEGSGHSNPNYLAVKVPEAEKPRPGDYAALFHLQRIMPQVQNVFDLGGSVGNLFYCYSKYLDFPPDLSWMVCDLATTNRLGETLADSRKEQRLRFTDQLMDADGADLLIISGALHYFEQPLSNMLAAFVVKPRYVLVNRAPLVDVPALATVQDGGTYRLACMLHNRNDLIQGLVTLGYELVDSWDIQARSVIIPCYPDWSAKSYSGLFFQLKRPEQAATSRAGPLP
jgi:putative methyltransferase (TIGR04325 family)